MYVTQVVISGTSFKKRQLNVVPSKHPGTGELHVALVKEKYKKAGLDEHYYFLFLIERSIEKYLAMLSCEDII